MTVSHCCSMVSATTSTSALSAHCTSCSTISARTTSRLNDADRDAADSASDNETAPMTIAVIGGGATGSLFASRLVLAGRKIWIFDKCREHVEAINRDGLKITRDGVTRSVR